MTRIRIKRWVKALKAIELEIVGHELNLSGFENYVQSEVIAQNVLERDSWIQSVYSLLQNRDKLIHKFFHDTPHDAHALNTVIDMLTLTLLNGAQKNGTDAYYHQLNVIHLDGNELDLALQAKADLQFAELEFVFQFIVKFQQFLKNSSNLPQ